MVYFIREIFRKKVFRNQKMKCDKCKNNPWSESFNDCKELEYCCYKCKGIVIAKDFIKHLGKHYDNPD